MAAITNAAANAQGKIDKAIGQVEKLHKMVVEYAEQGDNEQIQTMKGTIEALKGQLGTIAGKYADAKEKDLTAEFIRVLKNDTAPLREKLTATLSELHTQIKDDAALVAATGSMKHAHKFHEEVKEALEKVQRILKAITELTDIADLYTELIEKDKKNVAEKDKEIQKEKELIEKDKEDQKVKEALIAKLQDDIKQDKTDKATQDESIEKLKKHIEQDKKDKELKDEEIKKLKEHVEGLEGAIGVKDGTIEKLMKIIDAAHEQAHEVVH